jgi:hypothetical protein
VIVSVALPRLVVLTVSVEDPEPATDVGLKVAVVPRGNPETLKFTVPVNPFCEPMVTV